MALPRIDVPKFEVTLPGTTDIIKCRPFLVRESKILTLAVESEDKVGMLSACKQVVENCTEGLDVENLPLHKLQWLFLKLREKSVGEIQGLELMCGSCQTIVNYDMKINDFDFIGNIESETKKILINESAGFVLKYPSPEIQMKMEKMNESEILSSCIEYIFDDEEITRPNNDNIEEIVDFLESLTLEKYREAEEFLASLPTIANEVAWDCNNCKKHNVIVINGYEHFFV